jgi:hypothetical protein
MQDVCQQSPYKDKEELAIEEFKTPVPFPNQIPSTFRQSANRVILEEG